MACWEYEVVCKVQIAGKRRTKWVKDGVCMYTVKTEYCISVLYQITFELIKLGQLVYVWYTLQLSINKC